MDSLDVRQVGKSPFRELVSLKGAVGWRDVWQQSCIQWFAQHGVFTQSAQCCIARVFPLSAEAGHCSMDTIDGPDRYAAAFRRAITFDGAKIVFKFQGPGSATLVPPKFPRHFCVPNNALTSSADKARS